MKHRGVIAWAAIDFLSCLLLVVYTLIAPPATPPSIPTPGLYAVVITWPNGSPNDVDLYVEDPHDQIVYFAARDVDFMHLEHDDLGSGISDTTTVNGRTVAVQYNTERVIISQVIPGEYVVNVHMFNDRNGQATPVTAELVRLTGQDTVIETRTVMLHRSGDEQTEFRFTLNAQGVACCYSTLYKEVVYAYRTGSAGTSFSRPSIAGTP